MRWRRLYPLGGCVRCTRQPLRRHPRSRRRPRAPVLNPLTLTIADIIVRATGSATYSLGHSRPISCLLGPAEDDMGTFLVSVGIGLSTAAILSLSAVESP